MGSPGLAVERLVLSQLSSLGATVRERSWPQSQIRATQKAVCWTDLDVKDILLRLCHDLREEKSPVFSWEMLCFLPSWPLGQWQLLLPAVGLYWAVLEPDHCFLLGVPQINDPAELSKNYLCSLA